MKAKKIAKRLRRLSTEFRAQARDYGSENLAERTRLTTIADVCLVLANEVFTKPAATPISVPGTPFLPTQGD